MNNPRSPQDIGCHAFDQLQTTSTHVPKPAAERKANELDALSCMLAHQLRAPVQLVCGFARWIDETEGHKLSTLARARLSRTVAAAGRMDRLIEDLLAFARAPHQGLNKQEADVAGMVTEILADYPVEFPYTRIWIESLPTVRADAMVVRQVFSNLVANAFKFSQFTPQPLVEIFAVDGETFCVRDNGIGFDPGQAACLFNPFQRLTSDPLYSGTGLGLSTVKRLLDRHGGWIKYASREGGPTEFTFAFAGPPR